MTKSIRIPAEVHRELKVFASQHDLNIIGIAGWILMDGLKKRGHVFTAPKSNPLKPKNKKP
jgi:hypothetical protein